MKKQNLTIFLLAWLSFSLSAQHNYDNQSVIYSNNGKIGIGIDNPSHNLEVRGSGEQIIGLWSTDNQSRIHFRKMNTTQDGSIIYHTNGRFGFHLDDSSAGGVDSNEFMTILNNGNVGIGTNIPSQKLDVMGNAEINGYVNSIRSESTGQPVFYYSQNGTNSQYALRYTEQATGSIPADFWHFRLGGTAGANGVIWGATDNSHLTLLTSGQVGIGTASPSEKLDVEGNAEFGLGSGVLKIKQGNLNFEGSERTYLYYDHATNRKIGLGITDDTGVRNYIELFEGNVPSNQYIDFGINGSSVMKINSQGKVAIGTSDFSNNHKFRVEGSIGTREIKVEANGWSDFVFANDYNLRTLEEVETYITENKHLPEIPSETEVTENGINLGEMNAKLLMKIEELTLYMIEMNKRMGQLEAENAELKMNNQELSKKVQLIENQ